MELICPDSPKTRCLMSFARSSCSKPTTKCWGQGPVAAERFIGFPPGDADEYCHRSPADVDLSQFQIASAFERGFDFAYRPSVMNTLGSHEIQDLTVFMLGTPRSGGVSSGGETHPYMTPDGLCQTVADAAHARWKLEWDSLGAGRHTFTTRELALLANMTEGAIRNALSDKSENGLRAVPNSKNPVLVEHAEAWRWLKGRRGFIPSPQRPRDDRCPSRAGSGTQFDGGARRTNPRALGRQWRLHPPKPPS